MWLRTSSLHNGATLFRVSFSGYLFFVILAPVLLVSTPATPLANTVAITAVVVGIAIVIGRLLMFALAELEPRF
jgi:Na+/citrate or Na+/malate symporter